MGQSLAVALMVAAGAAAVAAEVPKRVVILDSSDPSEPVAQAFGRAIRGALTSEQRQPVQFFSEFLDALRLVSAPYQDRQVSLLREKYRDRPPDLIVTVYPDALAFLEEHRAELWPATPAVYVGVPDDFPAWSAPTPTVSGVRTHVDVAGTLALALELQPRTRRVVVVSGLADFDRLWRDRTRSVLEGYAGRLEAIYFDGLAPAALRQRLGQLTADTIVIFNTVFRDAEGPATPIDRAGLVAQASSVPVYSPFEPVLGTGVLGGRMVSLDAEANRAGALARAILDGRSPETVAVEPALPAQPRVDWRQLQRFGIAEARLPAGTAVLFRPVSVWSEHRGAIVGVLAVLGLQFALIAALLVERRQRRLAELRSRQRGLELAHAARLASVGEITASIAHQINQPLGAILSNADAADLLLDARPLQTAELRQILADIRRDDLRAHEVIQKIRAWLGQRDFQPQALGLNQAVTEVLELLQREAERLQVPLRSELRSDLPDISGDRVYLQQVVLNLVMNGLEAAAAGGGEATVTVRTAAVGTGDVEIAVTDTGPGIPPHHLARVFESFFTTKPGGMGLGLSIARSLVELHGGRIWAESGVDGGTTVRVVITGAPGPATEAVPGQVAFEAPPLGGAR